MVNRHFSLIDFNDYKNTDVTDLSFVSGNEPQQNQYTFNEDNKVVYCNANRGYFRVYTGRVNFGDVFIIRGNMYSESGVKPHVSVDFSDVKKNGNEVNTGNESISSVGTWEAVEFKFIVPKTMKYSSVVIGLTTGEIGKYKLNNMTIEVHSAKGNSIVETEKIIGSNYTIYKYSDDTQKIEMVQDFNAVKVEEAWGSLYGSGNIVLESFPIGFAELPHVTINITNNTGSGMMASTVQVPSKTNPGAFVIYRAVPTTITTVRVFVTATGIQL